MLAPSMRTSGSSRVMQQLRVLAGDEPGDRLVAARAAYVGLARGGHRAAQIGVGKQQADGASEVFRGERHAYSAAAFAQDALLVRVVVGDDRDAEREIFHDFGRRAAVEQPAARNGRKTDFSGAHVTPGLLAGQPSREKRR